MAKAAGELDHAASTIKGLQTQLGAHRDAVLVGWKGKASNAFGDAFVTFNEDMTKVLVAMNRLHESLVHNRINYEKAEELQTDSAKAIHQFLNGF
jgi:WXG100 family type VII secretion target